MTTGGIGFVPICPICSAQMAMLDDNNERRSFACGVCRTHVFVPVAAWSIAQEQRQHKWPAKS